MGFRVWGSMALVVPLPTRANELDDAFLVLDAGKTEVTLHGWMDGKKCGGEPLLELVVEVKAGASILAVVFTPDAGKTLASAQFPMVLQPGH